MGSRSTSNYSREGGRDILKNFFKQLFGNNDKEKGGIPRKTNYIIILGLIGLLMIIFSNIFSGSNEADQREMQNDEAPLEQPSEDISQVNSEPDSKANGKELEANYEKELENMLNQIQGVQEAEVMINLDSTDVHVYEKNLIQGRQTTEESDQHGGDRTVEDHTEESQVVLLRQGDREVPLLVQTKKPEVRGVFVIAKGAENKTVENWIVESVSRVLDVPTHRISVLPKN